MDGSGNDDLLAVAEPSQDVSDDVNDNPTESQDQPDNGLPESEAVSEQEDSNSDLSADQSEDQGQTEDDEASSMVTVEYGGLEYEVPKALEKAIMLDKDYTQKRQVEGELAKANETIRQNLDEMVQITQQERQIHGQLASVQQRLQEYSQVDWNAWEAQDPVAAQSGFREYQLLKDNVGQLQHNLQRAGAQRAKAAQQEMSKRIEATRSYAEKNIPGYSQDLDAKIIAHAATKVDPAMLARAMSPGVYDLLHQAWIGQQTLERATTKPKAVKAAQLKPTSKVKSKSGTGGKKSVDDMNYAEYEAHRLKQMKSASQR